jgi:conjugal transfer pilus assembly protein TraA
MKKVASIVAMVCIAILTASSVMAATGGTEFTQLYELIEGWTTGILGKTISLATFLVGMGFSVVQQSLVPVAVGVGASASLAYTPDVMSTIFTMVI